MILKQAGKSFAGADGVAAEDDFLFVFPKLGDVPDDGFVDIGALRALRREVARAIDCKIDDFVAFRLRERSSDVDRPFCDRRTPFLAAQIES